MQGMCKKRVSHLLSPLGARDVLLLSPPNQEQEATLLLSMKERSLRLPPTRWQQQPMQMPDPEVAHAHVFTCPCLSPLSLPTSANQCKFFSTGDQIIANPLLFSLNTLTNR